MFNTTENRIFVFAWKYDALSSYTCVLIYYILQRVLFKMGSLYQIFKHVFKYVNYKYMYDVMMLNHIDHNNVSPMWLTVS